MMSLLDLWHSNISKLLMNSGLKPNWCVVKRMQNEFLILGKALYTETATKTDSKYFTFDIVLNSTLHHSKVFEILKDTLSTDDDHSSILYNSQIPPAKGRRNDYNFWTCQDFRAYGRVWSLKSWIHGILNIWMTEKPPSFGERPIGSVDLEFFWKEKSALDKVFKTHNNCSTREKRFPDSETNIFLTLIFQVEKASP